MKISAVNTNSTNGSKKINQNISTTGSPIASRQIENGLAPFLRRATYATAIASTSLGIVYFARTQSISKFAKTIAHAMNKKGNIKVSPESLHSIMSGSELLRVLPKLKKQNFVFNPENIQNGVFRADLHSHSTYSDGEGLIKNLLDDVTDYADELYKKTKQKFIFALTDHDTAEGLKEVFEIISSNPKRYKNLQFVPGIELSFAHSAPKSSNPCEMSEVLVYGVNPFSPKVDKFLKNIKNKRTNMINNFIGEASKQFPLTKFSFEEFSKFYEFEKYGNLMNIHWRTYHYIQTKQAVTVYANVVKENPEVLYKRLMKENKGASIGLLQSKGLLPQDIKEQENVKQLLQNFAPHFENGKIKATSENTFEEVIDAFKDEPDVFMAFAHPCYYAQHVDNPAEGLKYFTEHSKGLIKASESFHQAYKQDINSSQISDIQTQTEKLNLLNLGGRDNHTKHLF